MKLTLILLLVFGLFLLVFHLFPRINFRPAPLGLCQGQLPLGKPNWVSSLVPKTDSHYIAALPEMPLVELGPLLQKSIPNLTLVEVSARGIVGYRRSWWFNFVDWFCISPEGQVSSSATMGYSDLGKNRELVEAMRTLIKETIAN